MELGVLGEPARSSATALIAGHFFVPESKDPNAPRLDLLGALLSIVGLGSLLFGIIEGPDEGLDRHRAVLAGVRWPV